MKKLICCYFFLISSNLFCNITEKEENFVVIKDKLERLSESDKQSKQNISENLKKYLAENYSQITNPNEKICIAELLKQFNELGKKNSENKPTIKDTILKTFTNLTSVRAITCATLLMVMHQFKGIITSKETIDLIEKLSKITTKAYWGGGVLATGIAVLSVIVKFINKNGNFSLSNDNSDKKH